MKKNTFLFAILIALVISANAQWQQTNGPCGGTIKCLTVNSNNIFAGTINGVFLSTNNGANWTATGLANTRVLSLAVSGNNIFAGTYGDGVYLSTNNGANWTAVNTGLANTDVRSLAVSGSNIFAGTDGGGVFLSTTNGANWTVVNTGLIATNVSPLAVSGSDIFAGTVDGIFLSTNNGANWTAVNTGLPNTDCTSLAVSGSDIFAGTYNSGVWKRALAEITGITEEINNNRILVYPNPASEILMLTTNKHNAEMEIKIYEITGILVKSEKLEQSQNSIYIGDLKNGIYMLAIKSKEFTETQRLFIQR